MALCTPCKSGKGLKTDHPIGPFNPFLLIDVHYDNNAIMRMMRPEKRGGFEKG